MENKTDVGLDEVFKSSEGNSQGASAKEVVESTNDSEVVQNTEDSVGSQRANERIRELVNENKSFKEQVDQLKSLISEPSKEQSSPTLKIDEFLSKIEDEPSRKLLKDFAGILTSEAKREALREVAPQLKELEFERGFDTLKKTVPQIEEIRDEVYSEYKRNPRPIKSIAGEIILDRQSNLKRIDSQGSSPSRKSMEKSDLNNLSKDELGELLDSMKE